jgi:hypothetical protein
VQNVILAIPPSGSFTRSSASTGKYGHDDSPAEQAQLMLLLWLQSEAVKQ